MMLASTTVGVMGSGRDEHEAIAGAVGRLLAGLEVNLLTGGGRGVMTSVSRAYTAARPRRGICIGIIPCEGNDRGTPKEGYPNEFVRLPIYTHLPFSGEKGKDDRSRNHINVLSCDAVVALPGGAGTAAEVSLAVEYGTPVVAYAPDPRAVAHFPGSVRRAATIDDVARFLAENGIEVPASGGRPEPA